MENTMHGDSISEKASTVGSKVSDTATQVKDRASQFGRTATKTIDENRDMAASGLDKAASALRENADSLPGGDTVTNLARSTADKLSSTAGYVREHDVRRMMGDVETVVKNNPGPSLLAAAAIGFLVGRAISND